MAVRDRRDRKRESREGRGCDEVWNKKSKSGRSFESFKKPNLFFRVLASFSDFSMIYLF